MRRDPQRFIASGSLSELLTAWRAGATGRVASLVTIVAFAVLGWEALHDSQLILFFVGVGAYQLARGAVMLPTCRWLGGVE